MIKIGNIELANIIDTEKKIKGNILLNNSIVGFLEADFDENEALTVKVAIDGGQKDCLITEVIRCLKTISDEEIDFDDAEEIIMELVYMLIKIYQNESDYLELKKIFEMDSYLKISYKNGEKAIIPSNNHYILAAIGAIVEKLDAVDRLEILTKDMYCHHDEDPNIIDKMMN